MGICGLIDQLINYAEEEKLINQFDKIYIRNGLLDLFKINEYKEEENKRIDFYSILDEMINYAIENELIENTNVNKDLFETKILGYICPLPSQINEKFWNYYKINPQKATDYFYDLCIKTNYIRKKRIEKDIKFSYPTEYGKLDISINMSKPEKDPNDIKKLLQIKKSDYPKCMLCKENINYAGRIDFPSRQNLRYISLNLNNNPFYFQYSPYSYYNEHTIVFSDEHKNMKVDIEAIKELLDFIDMFPHYFIGSNAGIPIVGGSILNHHHFQGGKATLPMENAKETLIFNYNDVDYNILYWPLSVIRLRSKNKQSIIEAAKNVFEKWKDYSNLELNIINEDENGLHNAITPIARFKNKHYELNLVLRNNITTIDRPLGYFHPRPEYFHIKKENIGLIEVMGLAILPSRLKKQMEIVKRYILGEKIESFEKEDLSIHLKWANDLKANWKNESIDELINNGIGEVFKKVLIDCGVFKKENYNEFVKFINLLK